MISDYIDEILKKQLENVPEELKLNYKDIKKILKFTNNNIFNNTKCCIWTGGIIKNKGLYINFYKNKKKISFHRLLYINFIDSKLDNKTYLSFNCENKGICCNINHIDIKKNIKKNVKNIIYFD